MEYVLKIYSNQNSSNPFNTVENLNNISFSWDLNDFSVMKIDLPINVSWLSQFNKIELCTTVDDTDVVEFWWYIHTISPSNGKITLECRNYKALMLKKIILSDKDFSWATLSVAINSILLEWKNETNEDWFFSTSFTGTFTKKFSEWDKLFDILDEIADLTSCVRNVVWNTIIFDEIIWTDRSILANPNFFELIFNGEDLTENNIDTISTSTYWTLSNMVIGKDNTWKVMLKDTTSITEFWVFSEYKSFREWNLAEQTQKFLDTKKNEQKIFSIKARKNIGNELNMWDKIHLRVENLNEYMNIETDVFILKKEVSIENGTKIINLTVSEIYATIDTLTGKLNRIQKDIHLLSL